MLRLTDSLPQPDPGVENSAAVRFASLKQAVLAFVGWQQYGAPKPGTDLTWITWNEQTPEAPRQLGQYMPTAYRMPQGTAHWSHGATDVTVTPTLAEWMGIPPT